MYSKKKTPIFLVFALIVFLMPSFAFPVYADSVEEIIGPAIEIVVDDVAFDQSERSVAFSLDLRNRSESFIDTLQYRIELYKGDTLATSGLIFSELDFVISAEGSVAGLQPLQQKKESILYNPPRSLDSGTYFFRVFVYSEDTSFYGATYTTEGITLRGDGGFVGPVYGHLIHPIDNTSYGLKEGPLLPLNTVPVVAIEEFKNEKLFELIKNESVNTITYDIFHINEKDVSLVSNKTITLDSSLLLEDASVLQIPIEVWENQKSGGHTVVFDFLNEENVAVSESLEVRVLFEGLIGRILKTDSSINSYKKGEPISLDVSLIVAGDPAVDFVSLKAEIKSTDGNIQTVEKDIEVPKTTMGVDTVVSFVDVESDTKKVVEQIILTLETKDGIVLDTYVLDVDTSVLFTYPQSEKPWVAVLIVLILILSVYFYVRTNKKNSAVALLFFVGAAGLLHGVHVIENVYADAQLQPSDFPGIYSENCEFFSNCKDVYDLDGDGVTDGGAGGGNSGDGGSGDGGEFLPSIGISGALMSIWETPVGTHQPSGDQGICEGQCEEIVFWLKLQCKHCDNAPRTIDVNFFNDWKNEKDIPTQTFALNTSAGFNYADSDAEITYLANTQAYDETDTIDFWIYGPFTVDFCFNDSGIAEVDGMCQQTASVDSEGLLEQEYNIQAETQFGEGYCELSYSEDSVVEEDKIKLLEGIEEVLALMGNTITLNNIHTVSCTSPACLKTKLFLDTNRDGARQSGELYIRPEGTPDSWGGVVANVSGKILDTAGLPLAQDVTTLYDGSPYLLQSFLTPETYTLSLDGDGSGIEWRQTSTNQSVTLQPGETETLELGVTNIFPVSFTCGPGDPQDPDPVDPRITKLQGLQQESCLNSDWNAGPTNEYTTRNVNGDLYVTIPVGTGGKRHIELLTDAIEVFGEDAEILDLNYVTYNIMEPEIDPDTGFVRRRTFDGRTNSDTGALSEYFDAFADEYSLHNSWDGSDQTFEVRYLHLKERQSWYFCPIDNYCTDNWWKGYGCNDSFWGLWCRSNGYGQNHPNYERRAYWLPYPYWTNNAPAEDEFVQGLIASGYTHYPLPADASKWTVVYKTYSYQTNESGCRAPRDLTYIFREENI